MNGKASDLDALEALCGRASPGPWYISAAGHCGEAGQTWRINVAFTGGGGMREPDAAFIAAARTALPALCQRVRDLEHTNASLRAAVNVYEVYAKRLEADLVKLRMVAHAAHAYLLAWDPSPAPGASEDPLEPERKMRVALAALEASDG